MNLHGHWTGKNKGDVPARLEQSRTILETLGLFGSTPTVLCGDFNLVPDTDSIRMIETKMRNLVVEHGVTSTRTSLYAYEEKFADYVFVTGTNELGFSVLPDEVSDHAPLMVEIA